MFPNENHRRQSRCVVLWLAGALLAAYATKLVGAPPDPPDREQALAYFREGNGLLDRNRFADAAAAYTKAIEQFPEFAEAFHNRAVAREMVDRPLAIEDWRRFVELAEGVAARRFDVARARARLQILEAMPPLPEAMDPSRYDTGVGDYYWLVSRTSENELWPRLPVKVFLGRTPEHKWQEGVREAYDTWAALFPMQLTALPKDADIRMAWDEPTSERGRAGETYEYVRIELEGGVLTGRRVALIVVDQSRNWSKGEMRAIILHELGHALGIKGHSDSKDDIMFWQLPDGRRSINVPRMPFPIFWRSLPKAPSQRDLNTLIRLYNTAGTVTRFQ